MSEEIEGVIDAAADAGHGDISIAMREIHNAVAENYPDDDAVDDAMEDVVLPFHDTDRQMAFALGVNFGVLLEQAYPEDSDEGDDDPARGE